MQKQRCKRNGVDYLFYTINRAIIEFLRDIMAGDRKTGN
jgi:hypothetical protein